MPVDFNAIVNAHADAQLRATETVAPAADSPPGDSHRGWSITWGYGYFTATSPNYDASYEGPEDGWVDNGERVSARTREGVIEEIDAWIAEHGA